MALILPGRRSLLAGVFASGLAPVVVRAESLMRGRGELWTPPPKKIRVQFNYYGSREFDMRPTGEVRGEWELWTGTAENFSASCWLKRSGKVASSFEIRRHDDLLPRGHLL